MENNVLTLLSPLSFFCLFQLCALQFLTFLYFPAFDSDYCGNGCAFFLPPPHRHPSVFTRSLPLLSPSLAFYILSYIFTQLDAHMEQFMKRHNDVMLHIVQCYSHFPYNILPHWGKDYSDFDQFTWLDHYTVQWNSSGRWLSTIKIKDEEKWSTLSYAKITEIGIDITNFSWLYG